MLQNKLPQIWKLKAKCIYYLSIFVAQNPRHRLTGFCVPGFLRLLSGQQPGLGLVPNEDSTKEGSAPKSVGLFLGGWTEGVNCWLAIAWRPSSFPCHVGLPNVAACFIPLCSKDNLIAKDKSQSFFIYSQK